MINKLFYSITFILGLSLLISSCKNDNTQTPEPSYTLTQTDLNNSTQNVEMDVTGRKYGSDVSIPHGGSNLTTEETYRDIYKNASKKSTNADAPGTVYTKRTYMKNADGSKGALLVTFAMAKRETGYYTDGGDWEYVMMPNDGTNDYVTNPNGTLPSTSATDMRGQLASCAGCHSKASTDFIFSNGDAPAFTATQSDLNAATNEEDIGVTGTKYGADVSIPHGGTSGNPDSTFRDIYSNIGAQEDIRVGAVLAKRTYAKNADGSQGPLLITFAMIKHEEGYFPSGGDFEYVMMPNDGSNDYSSNPNGMLPDASALDMRGKLESCAGCHSKVSGYSFVRGVSM